MYLNIRTIDGKSNQVDTGENIFQFKENIRKIINLKKFIVILKGQDIDHIYNKYNNNKGAAEAFKKLCLYMATLATIWVLPKNN